jgi:hypothetical protein
MTLLVWLSFALCALIFLAIAGIPLWFVLRHKEWGPRHHDGGSVAGRSPQPDEVLVPEREPAPAQLAGTGGRVLNDRG